MSDLEITSEKCKTDVATDANDRLTAETITPASELVPEHQTIELEKVRRYSAMLCATILGICFFLPWLRILIVNVSGAMLAKEGGYCALLWLMPILCLFTIISCLVGNGARTAAQLAGLSPFGVLAFGIYGNGRELTQALDVGAWASLLFGLALFLLGCRLKN